MSEFAQKAAENPAVTAGWAFPHLDEEKTASCGTEARNRGHLVADQKPECGARVLCVGLCRSLSRSEKAAQASFATLRRLRRPAAAFKGSYSESRDCRDYSASAWPTREKRRVTKEACNRIKRRPLKARQGRPFLAPPSPQKAVSGLRPAFLCQRLKAFAGERSGSLLLGDEKARCSRRQRVPHRHMLLLTPNRQAVYRLRLSPSDLLTKGAHPRKKTRRRSFVDKQS